MSMTVKELLRNVSATAKRINDATILKAVPAYTKKGHLPVLRVVVRKHTNPDGSSNLRKNTQKCTITGLTKDTDLVKDPIKVSCTCEYFTYVCEYALHKKGAADIIHSNGEPPKNTNPSLVPTVCVHLYKVLTELNKQRR